ncbi:hypothetical protein [Paraburkholderia acidisoli]|uniref:Uncharacterized protein n=1 Tax=Paraburkholderia acidisoli TaxID=2571748 RepID=A0A7Z2GRF8_9BURK|nr:hypothetical protein [Paraburkholderia acidisoli]QGZ66254.1 hypothetical protein FAZ98_31115 [Paraburkholderia acidisoli]QGZ66344.1 hypothetical protein FAZ98_31620 [Paraburkholderia acidisoli]
MTNFEKTMATYQASLDDNTAATLRVEGNTQELVELLKMAKSGLGFFTGTGRVLRKVVLWCGPFIMFAAAIWGLAHGKWPGES